jgi:hypothetical protein
MEKRFGLSDKTRGRSSHLWTRPQGILMKSSAMQNREVNSGAFLYFEGYYMSLSRPELLTSGLKLGRNSSLNRRNGPVGL